MNQEVVIAVSAPAETEILVALLEDALASEPVRRAVLIDAGLTSYAAYRNSELINSEIVGGVVVRWGSESEIELLAVERTQRGQGVGRAIVAEVVEEARRRGVTRLLVGTGNFSLDNIAFYQKCGFRLSHIRRGYFDDVDPPEIWQGIRLRDMIMFDYGLAEEAPKL